MDLMYIRFSLSIFCVLNHLNKISSEKEFSTQMCDRGLYKQALRVCAQHANKKLSSLLRLIALERFKIF